MAIYFLKKAKLVGFGIIVLGLIYYQIVKGDFYLEKARNNYVKVVPYPAIRGSILDRQGATLAFDEPSFSIAVMPEQVRRQPEIFNEIAQATAVSTSLLEENYRKGFQKSFSPVDILTDVDKQLAMTAKEKLDDKIHIRVLARRIYPYPHAFAHVLGYVKKALFFYDDLKQYGYEPLERAGFLGVEQYYDTYLKGESGGDLLEVNARGQLVGYAGKKAATRGSDIYLTVDARMQLHAYNTLKRYRGGVIIVMDAQKGDILVLVSYPSYDLNKFIKGQEIAKIINAKSRPMINRASEGLYPMGSVIKPFLGAGALQDGVITTKTSFECKGAFSLGRSRFRCLHTHGPQNITPP